MVRAHTLDERRSVALKAVSVQLFGEGSDDLQKQVKAWLNEENARRRKEAKANGTEFEPCNYSHVPRDLMSQYGMEDDYLQAKIRAVYEPRLEQAPDLKECYEFERKAMDALYAVEMRGIPASADDYRMLEMEANDNLDALMARCKQLAGSDDFNPASSAQIIQALKDRKADMSFMETTDGKIKKADAENLRAVDDELAQAILNFRAEAKVLSTYVRPMLGRHYESSLNSYKEGFIAPDGRIHATYRQVGARTGRMSCSDPNMQNQPRDDLRLRYCIRAEPGMKLVTCDLSNIEMVLFAAYAGDGRLLRTLKEGGDLHELTAQMLGFRDRARPGGVFESARQQGKTYNFSRVYGGGIRTIRKSFRCSTDQARIYKKRFDDAYPEVQRLAARIEVALHQRGYVQDNIISKRRFRVDVRDAYKATNYLVQGTASSILKEAMIKLHADGVPMVAAVHDEIVAHVDARDAEEARRLIIQRMTENEAIRELVPLSADGVIVDRWSQAKDPNWQPGWVNA